MGQTEFALRGQNSKVSRALWFYFPSSVDLGHAPLPSKTLMYSLQAELPGEYLKMTIRTESSCLSCTCLPTQMVGSILYPTQISGVSVHYCMSTTFSAPYYLQGYLLASVWTSQSLISRFGKLLHGTNLVYLELHTIETDVVSIANISHNSTLPLQ